MSPTFPSPQREAIREIFLRRRIEYTPEQAAKLLRMSAGEVLALIERGVLHADVKPKRRQPARRTPLIPWSELASYSLVRWSVIQICDALGEEANDVLPRLLRPVEVKRLHLPEYQVRLIEILAEHEGVSIEHFVSVALLNLETADDPDEMEKLLPGPQRGAAVPVRWKIREVSGLTRLEGFIRRNGIVRRRLAMQAGVSRQQLLRLRVGEADAKRQTMIRLARACGRLLRRKVKVSELFDLGT